MLNPDNKTHLDNKTESEPDANTVALAIHGWTRGRLEPVLELYEKYGTEIFRKLPEKHWRLSRGKITLYRGLKRKELDEDAPVMYGGMDHEKKIQTLTSWTWDIEFARQWAGKDGKVIALEAEQDDVAFAPLDASRHRNEKEVVIANYHLKKDKIKIL